MTEKKEAEKASAKSSSSNKPGYRDPGWRQIKTTSVFRVVNPELFIKPNKKVMAVGLALITGCVAYLGYLNATTENRRTYMSMTEEGNLEKRYRTSRWD